jgi:hypothetical protein
VVVANVLMIVYLKCWTAKLKSWEGVRND